MQRIKLGACKGKLLPILEEYLRTININVTISQSSRKVYYEFVKDNYILEVYVLRYEDLIKYSDYFDLMLYGTDQVLEISNDCKAMLKYFEQPNCRLSILRNNDTNKKQIDKIATSYSNIAGKFLNIDKDNIINMKGSVEVAPYMNIADFVLDIIVTGNSAIENNLSEYKKLIDVGAVLTTKKVDKIELYRELGLITGSDRALSFAIDGIDGSGKTLLSNMLLNSRLNTNPNILKEPFHTNEAREAFNLWKQNKYLEWAKAIVTKQALIKNVNYIYDRSIITCLTDLIDNNYSKEDILNVINSWYIPEIIFFIDIPLKLAIQRNSKKDTSDEFDTNEQIIKYYELYKKGAIFLKENNITDVLFIDGTQEIEEEVETVKKELKRRL